MMTGSRFSAGVVAIATLASCGGSRGSAATGDVPSSASFAFEATFTRGPGTPPEKLTLQGHEASVLVTASPAATTAVGRYSAVIDESLRAALERAMREAPTGTSGLASDTPAVRCSMVSGALRIERSFARPPTAAGLQTLLARIQMVEQVALAHPREAIRLELAAPTAPIDAGRRAVIRLRVQNAGSDPLTVVFDGAPDIEAAPVPKPARAGETTPPPEWARVGSASPGVALLHLPTGAQVELPVELMIAESGRAALRARFDGALALTGQTNQSMHFHATLVSRATAIDVR
jgi:hypothetical protein